VRAIGMPRGAFGLADCRIGKFSNTFPRQWLRAITLPGAIHPRLEWPPVAAIVVWALNTSVLANET